MGNTTDPAELIVSRREAWLALSYRTCQVLMYSAGIGGALTGILSASKAPGLIVSLLLVSLLVVGAVGCLFTSIPFRRLRHRRRPDVSRRISGTS